MTTEPRSTSGSEIDLSRQLRHYDRSQLWYQLKEIVDERVYLRHGIEVSPGDVVLDVGANVGVAAAFFAAECGAAAVHSFEPVPPLYELLCENLARFPACTAHPYGLGARPGRCEITYYPGAAAMSGLHANPKLDREHVRRVMLNMGRSEVEIDRELEGRYRPESVDGELRTVSAVLSELALGRVDLLKIDVEMAEQDVLLGVAEGDWQLIRQLAIEVHDVDGRLPLIAADLGMRGFRVVTEQEDALRGTSVHMLYATRSGGPAE